jgi:hypothetical protein
MLSDTLVFCDRFCTIVMFSKNLSCAHWVSKLFFNRFKSYSNRLRLTAFSANLSKCLDNRHHHHHHHHLHPRFVRNAQRSYKVRSVRLRTVRGNVTGRQAQGSRRITFYTTRANAKVFRERETRAFLLLRFARCSDIFWRPIIYTAVTRRWPLNKIVVQFFRWTRESAFAKHFVER